MRFFHLADLHIGKIVNGYSMIEDQLVVLQQVITLIKEHHPDAVILAGDVYDRRNPPVEAVRIFSDFISEVVLSEGVPVLAIGGNHDSGERLNFGAELLSQAGFYLAGSFSWPVPKVRLFDADGPVDIYLLAYADLALIREMCPETQGMDYSEAMSWVITHISLDAPRNILVAHGMVAGDLPPETSDSERTLSVGGTDSWPVQLTSSFSYTALGHLHRAQKVTFEKVQYAGSLLAYSFSEEGQQKVVLEVDMSSDGSIGINRLPLNASHPLRTVRGELNNILENAPLSDYREDYLQVILTDKGELIEPMQRLKQAFPRIMLLKRDLQNTDETMSEKNLPLSENKDPMGLFCDFYKLVTGEEADNKRQQVMQQVLERLERRNL